MNSKSLYFLERCIRIPAMSYVVRPIMLCVCLVMGIVTIMGPVNAQEKPETETQRQSGSVIQAKPVWEFGVGGGYFSGFDYPASKDQNQRFLALPYFVYRSPKFRLGDGGIKAVAIENPDIKLDLSIGGSLNANSEGNSAREGMPDLDFLFEIGPQLEVRLWDQPVDVGGRVRVRFTSELRAVLRTDFSSVSSQGWVAETGLGVNFRNAWNSGVDWFAAIDTTYANEKLQDYFYEVTPEFATANRPVFDAKGGYLETRLFTGIGIAPVKNVRVFLGVFTGLFDGASNQDSPLFETKSSTGFALGFVWRLMQSERSVEIVDLGSNN